MWVSQGPILYSRKDWSQIIQLLRGGARMGNEDSDLKSSLSWLSRSQSSVVMMDLELVHFQRSSGYVLWSTVCLWLGSIKLALQEILRQWKLHLYMVLRPWFPWPASGRLLAYMPHSGCLGYFRGGWLECWVSHAGHHRHW